MLDSEICKDLSARLGGAPIGVCEGEGGALLAALSGGGTGLVFTKYSKDCAAYIFADAENADVAVSCGKPYIVISDAADAEKRYGCTCVAPAEYSDEWLSSLLRALAGEFPLLTIGVDIPEWMRFLPKENSAVCELLAKVREVSSGICKIKHVPQLSALTEGTKYWSPEIKIRVDFSSGCAVAECGAKDGIFFEMLSEIAGDNIDGEYTLMRYVRSASEAKKGYAKVRDALDCARVNGYGIVSPAEEDLSYEQPQVVRQGSSVGIKLKASAPTYHVIRVDVSGEVSPIMGDSSQSESLVKSMMSGFETDPEQTWNTDVFGRSLRCMVQEGLASKVSTISEDTRTKLRKAITRMANEGKGGVICIIL